ncbi:MAG: Npun_F5749 family FMN-dependent PPOX-type flavoprotein [Microcoleaceae cyanobacterium]
MTLAPWRSPLSRSIHQNRSLVYSRYLQLATVRADHRPANRTVVFRGFLEETNSLKFVTDSRSEKIEQIAENSWGEACWYFPKTREQFRFLGQLQIITVTDIDSESFPNRNLAWQDLSDNGKTQFYWPFPGKPRADSEAFEVTDQLSEHPPENFCLLLLHPGRVDRLELKGEPQNRTLYELQPDQTWSVTSVNP